MSQNKLTKNWVCPLSHPLGCADFCTKELSFLACRHYKGHWENELARPSYGSWLGVHSSPSAIHDSSYVTAPCKHKIDVESSQNI